MSALWRSGRGTRGGAPLKEWPHMKCTVGSSRGAPLRAQRLLCSTLACTPASPALLPTRQLSVQSGSSITVSVRSDLSCTGPGSRWSGPRMGDGGRGWGPWSANPERPASCGRSRWLACRLPPCRSLCGWRVPPAAAQLHSSSAALEARGSGPVSVLSKRAEA